jgi:hypothetical protein
MHLEELTSMATNLAASTLEHRNDVSNSVLLARLGIGDQPLFKVIDGKFAGEAGAVCRGRGCSSGDGRRDTCALAGCRSGHGSGRVVRRYRSSGSSRRGRRTGPRTGSAIPELGAGNRVLRIVALVHVPHDALLTRSVERRAEHAIRCSGPASSDVNVEAEGVVLGAADGFGAVKGNGLMSEDVAASGEGLRHLDGPGVVVCDHVDGSPFVVCKAGLFNLGPLERGLVGGGAGVAVALGDVGNHGTDMAIGPLGPLEVEGSAGLDGGSGCGRFGINVADDVGAVDRGPVTAYVAVVEALGGPPDDILGDGSGVVVVVLPAGEVFPIGENTADGAVGKGSACKGGNSKDDGHVDVCRRRRLELVVEVIVWSLLKKRESCLLHTVK